MSFDHGFDVVCLESIVHSSRGNCLIKALVITSSRSSWRRATNWLIICMSIRVSLLLSIPPDWTKHVYIRSILGWFWNNTESSVIRVIVRDCCQIGRSPSLWRNWWVLMNTNEWHFRSKSFAFIAKCVVKSSNVPYRPRHILRIPRVPSEIAWQNSTWIVWFIFISHSFQDLFLNVFWNSLILRHTWISILDWQ